MGEAAQDAEDGFVMLQAIAPERNVARRYAIEMSTDLFGATIVDYAWGRIGAGGRRRRVSFEARAEALQFVFGLVRRRLSARQRIGVGYAVVDAAGSLSVG